MTHRRECLPAVGNIGILGGSFDPAHAGHRHVTLWALHKFQLDAVLWLISPGNPIKPEPFYSYASRVQRARAIARHPRIIISTLEECRSLTYTVDTITLLKRTNPHCRFLWLMGSDNLPDFHRWHAWRTLTGLVSIGVLERPAYRVAACTSIAARALACCRVPKDAAPTLARLTPPAWTLVNIPLNPVSSTMVRASVRHCLST
ncbi:MAG: nicotinate-nucleotide adenylyltransferase [Rhodobacteraceae bacterium]|nr:nicotinate-nucleotide adenylyltransferase [Paracoccaceae bacterium]